MIERDDETADACLDDETLVVESTELGAGPPVELACVSDARRNELCRSTARDSTGLRACSGGRVLAAFLAGPRGALLAGCAVAELGCGTGLCGVVAARRARRVVLSDADPRALAVARRNCARDRRHMPP